jgi:chromosome segregation ATPase
MTNKKYHHSQDDDVEENMNKLTNQPPRVQQNAANQNRMHPGVSQHVEQYTQYSNQTQQMQQKMEQMQQYINEMSGQFSMKEQQYQSQLQSMGNKMGKYEEYLKTLMAKYNELKEDRDLLKERFKNNSTESNVNKYALDAIEEKKRELLALSKNVQEKIAKLEQLQRVPETPEN